MKRNLQRREVARVLAQGWRFEAAGRNYWRILSPTTGLYAEGFADHRRLMGWFIHLVYCCNIVNRGR